MCLSIKMIRQITSTECFVIKLCIVKLYHLLIWKNKTHTHMHTCTLICWRKQCTCCASWLSIFAFVLLFSIFPCGSLFFLQILFCASEWKLPLFLFFSHWNTMSCRRHYVGRKYTISIEIHLNVILIPFVVRLLTLVTFAKCWVFSW